MCRSAKIAMHRPEDVLKNIWGMENYDPVIMLYRMPDDVANPESWIFPEISDSVEYPGTGWDWRQFSGRGISGVECL